MRPAKLHRFYLFKIPHKISFTAEDYSGWQATIPRKDFYDFLPKSFALKTEFAYPRICGSLLTPFINFHKYAKRGLRPLDPYTTKESFLATIVHEFGHVYWSQYKLWWYSNKKENLRYLAVAQQLYRKSQSENIRLRLPSPVGMGEIFAFCAEYYVASKFWPEHRKNLDLYILELLKQLTIASEKKDLEKSDSGLEPDRYSHNLAFFFGKIILSQYPDRWPQILTRPLLIETTEGI